MMITTCRILWIPWSCSTVGGGPGLIVCVIGVCGAEPPQPAITTAVTGARKLRSALRRAGRLFVKGREVLLASTAHRTEPGLRNVLECGPGRDTPVRVALFGVVDEPTRFAHPLHAVQIYRRVAERQRGWAAGRTPSAAPSARPGSVSPWILAGPPQVRSSIPARRPCRGRPPR